VIGSGAPAGLAALACHPQVRAHVRDAISGWNARQRGASHRVERVILLSDAPSIDANEITDKGYINQRLALECRRADVERLFAAAPNPEVIVLDGQ
jgi:feruloyl-CoA synthase